MEHCATRDDVIRREFSPYSENRRYVKKRTSVFIPRRERTSSFLL